MIDVFVEIMFLLQTIMIEVTSLCFFSFLSKQKFHNVVSFKNKKCIPTCRTCSVFWSICLPGPVCVAHHQCFVRALITESFSFYASWHYTQLEPYFWSMALYMLMCRLICIVTSWHASWFVCVWTAFTNEGRKSLGRGNNWWRHRLLLIFYVVDSLLCLLTVPTPVWRTKDFDIQYICISRRTRWLRLAQCKSFQLPFSQTGCSTINSVVSGNSVASLWWYAHLIFASMESWLHSHFLKLDAWLSS